MIKTTSPDVGSFKNRNLSKDLNSYCFTTDLESETYLHMYWLSVLDLAGIELIFLTVAGNYSVGNREMFL